MRAIAVPSRPQPQYGPAHSDSCSLARFGTALTRADQTIVHPPHYLLRIVSMLTWHRLTGGTNEAAEDTGAGTDWGGHAWFEADASEECINGPRRLPVALNPLTSNYRDGPCAAGSLHTPTATTAAFCVFIENPFPRLQG